MPPRVVITGIGVLTPIGESRDVVWNNLLAGRCGISRVTSFDLTEHKTHQGAEVRGFDARKHVQKLEPSSLGRTSQFAIAAGRMALDDASADLSTFALERVGVSMGTTSGEPQIIERFNDRYINGELRQIDNKFIQTYPCHVIAANLAAELEIDGITTTIPTACAAGNYAIACAYDLLRAGRADLMLAGGADSFSRITYTGFERLGAIAPEFCQPFDRNRKGMIPGEGAGILVIETLDKARARGARIYAEITGYGLSCDAHHMTGAHPNGDGAKRAMEKALHDSRTQPDEVNYISAHGTGTPANDRMETLAVKRVFKEAAHRIPISSIKSMLGHTMGAASAIEAAACALTIHTNKIPPTIHLEEPDPECDLDYVPNSARDHNVNVAMNNAYAFGGNNASVIFRRYAN